MYTVPLYFQIAMGVSDLDAGARLVPAVVGNALGGLLCGFIIKRLVYYVLWGYKLLKASRTGRYWPLTLGGLLFACLGYILIIVRWRGNTNWAESLYILPGGFGMGTAMSTTFVAITAGVDQADFAVAGTGLYQSFGLGAASAPIVMMTVLQSTLRPMLSQALRSVGNRDEVCSLTIRRTIA